MFLSCKDTIFSGQVSILFGKPKGGRGGDKAFRTAFIKTGNFSTGFSNVSFYTPLKLMEICRVEMAKKVSVMSHFIPHLNWIIMDPMIFFKVSVMSHFIPHLNQEIRESSDFSKSFSNVSFYTPPKQVLDFSPLNFEVSVMSHFIPHLNAYFSYAHVNQYINPCFCVCNMALFVIGLFFYIFLPRKSKNVFRQLY